VPTYHIPFLMNRRFVGRKKELDLLQQRLMVDRDCQELSIVGLGGTGKTQLALQFVYSVKDKWPEYSIFWVPVLSMESFEQACVSIAKILGMPQMADDKEDAKELVKEWLSSSQAGRWLMVVDNADDHDIMFGTAESQGIVDYLPKSENGVMLYTTRTMEVAVSLTQYDVLELEAMDRRDATDFLSKSLIRKELLRDRAMTDKLLDELTCLPLAIAQAAAYLNMNRTTTAKYLQLLHSTEQDLIGLLSREFRDNTRYKGSSNAVATTWVVSFSQLRERNALAADLLEFISCIEWKAIPRSLLPDKESEEEMENAIGTLCGYSFLVRRESDDQGTQHESEEEHEEERPETKTEEWYDIHRLVHLATRIWVQRHRNVNEIAEDAIRHVAYVFPSAKYENQAVWRSYLPHAMRLLEVGQDSSLDEQSELCVLIGRCLQYEGRIREEIVWFEKSCQQRSQLSEDHPGRLLSEQELARAYLENGQVQESVALLERIVKVKETLALEDPSRLTSQHLLALAYRYQRQLEKSTALLEHVVKVKEMLAPENLSRLASQHALATVYLADEQVQKAIVLLEYVFKMREKTLSPEHPLRLESQHELARAYLEDGQVQRAIALLEHVVKVEEKTLLPEHSFRLSAQHELARAYLADRQVQKAVDLLEYVVKVEEKRLLLEHSYRLTSQHELARAYLEDGQVQRAVALLEYVFKMREKTLSPEHPSRLESEYVLARAYLEDGQVQKAVELLEYVVNMQEKTLLPEHSFRLKSQHLLAIAYEKDGQVQKAIALLLYIVKVEEVLAPEHPSRLVSQHALATAYLADGQVQKAVDLLECIVKVEEKTLLPEHPDRLTSQHVLAVAYYNDGQLQKAVELLEYVVDIESRTLRNDDPSRQISVEALTTILADMAANSDDAPSSSEKGDAVASSDSHST
jgi:tetratricopeptide (TPR) repeat protein